MYRRKVSRASFRDSNGYKWFDLCLCTSVCLHVCVGIYTERMIIKYLKVFKNLARYSLYSTKATLVQRLQCFGMLQCCCIITGMMLYGRSENNFFI